MAYKERKLLPLVSMKASNNQDADTMVVPGLIDDGVETVDNDLPGVKPQASPPHANIPVPARSPFQSSPAGINDLSTAPRRLSAVNAPGRTTSPPDSVPAGSSVNFAAGTATADGNVHDAGRRSSGLSRGNSSVQMLGERRMSRAGSGVHMLADKQLSRRGSSSLMLNRTPSMLDFTRSDKRFL